MATGKRGSWGGDGKPAAVEGGTVASQVAGQGRTSWLEARRSRAVADIVANLLLLAQRGGEGRRKAIGLGVNGEIDDGPGDWACGDARRTASEQKGSRAAAAKGKKKGRWKKKKKKRKHRRERERSAWGDGGGDVRRGDAQ